MNKLGGMVIVNQLRLILGVINGTNNISRSKILRNIQRPTSATSSRNRATRFRAGGYLIEARATKEGTVRDSSAA